MTNVRYTTADGVATIVLDRPERKNPLTFEVYAELRDWFRTIGMNDSVKAILLTGEGQNFCSGGDVREIIGVLAASAPELQLQFTQMTGDVVKAMRACPQPIVSAIDGVCAGAGAILAMASDLRYGTARSAVSFLFVRVGLAGCDMGACAMLPRLIGLGRAAELLYTGGTLDGTQALRWGFYNGLFEADEVRSRSHAIARAIAQGPTVAHAMTKKMLHAEWAMPLDDAIDAEAHAQAICMQTQDFRRAYEAFIAKQSPVFEGN